ncbi:MAG: hypothetical protein HN368_13615 [Spirochaetales bacterium]|nr:hypothetical protein [Spirochaetales bacterium]
MLLHNNAICLSGADWLIHEGVDTDYDEVMNHNDGWLNSQVPGNIQADLEQNLLLKPLWYGNGDSRLMDYCLKDWWYRKDFQVPDNFQGKRLTLIFDGVDYSCEIWVNGSLVDHHDGMFQRFDFDVTDFVNVGKVNRLGVKISGMPEELVPWIEGSDGAFSGVGTDYFFVHANDKIRETLKGLKSPANCSYDWGTNIYTLGIWKDVQLKASGPVRIEWVQVKTRLEEDFSAATAEVIVELDSEVDMEITAKFSLSGPEKSGSVAVNGALIPGKNTIRSSISVDNPRLWWPAGHGEQALYMLETMIAEDEGEPLDHAETRFGIRDVRWEQVEGAPEDFANPYRLVLNGRTIRTMGSNMTAVDLLFGRADGRYRHFVEMARECNMNTLRLHGGQIIYPQSMYDAADDLGIMLLVDFPMGNCAPEKDPVFLKNLDETISNIVKQLRNHPSVVEWSGGNEMSWCFDSTVEMAALEVERDATAREDGTRLFRDTCPIDGGRHSPWDYNPDLTYTQFNEDILDNMGENPMMRYGEFGCQTPANLEVWHRDIPLASRWPIDEDDPVLIRKNAVSAVFDRDFWLCKGTIERLFGELDDLEMLIRCGQFIGAEGVRYMMDALRAKGGRVGGFTSWDYNEPWPNGAGSFMIDYDGRPLMMYHFVKQALAPVSLQLRHEGIEYSFYGDTFADLLLVSDAPEKLMGLTWKWTARARNGEVFGSGTGKAEISPLDVMALAQIRVNPPQALISGPVIVELVLSNSTGQVISERFCVFGAKGVRAPLRGLVKDAAGHNGYGMPYVTTAICGGKVEPAELNIEEKRAFVRGECEFFEVILKNSGSMTAIFVEIKPTLEYRTDLFIDNNFAFIPPGESRIIAIRALVREGLSLPETGWNVTCWNAEGLTIPPADSILLYMGRRDSTCRGYQGYFDGVAENPRKDISLEGNVIDCGNVPYALNGAANFIFESRTVLAASLRIHASDTDSSGKGTIVLDLNGHAFHKTLPAGLGVQLTTPEHLAYPRSQNFNIPEGVLVDGKNKLRIEVRGGWLTWDALDLVAR